MGRRYIELDPLFHYCDPVNSKLGERVGAGSGRWWHRWVPGKESLLRGEGWAIRSIQQPGSVLTSVVHDENSCWLLSALGL